MKKDYYFAVAKIKSVNKLKTALLHNLRLLNPANNIIQNLSQSNFQIGESKTIDAALDHFKLLKRQFNIRFRKNQIIAIEIVISAPNITKKTGFDNQLYFYACRDFLIEEFRCPILSAVVHLDESHPHSHFILIPIVDGKMSGARILGGPPEFNRRREKFRDVVLSRFFNFNSLEENCSKRLSDKLIRNVSQANLSAEKLMPLVKFFIKRNPEICVNLLPKELRV